MSSLVDAIINSDLPSTPHNDDNDATPRARGRTRHGGPSSVRSSSRGLGLTSDADHEMQLDPDDEVVGAKGTVKGSRPRADLANVPKVTDEAGEQIKLAFIDFLEK